MLSLLMTLPNAIPEVSQRALSATDGIPIVDFDRKISPKFLPILAILGGFLLQVSYLFKTLITFHCQRYIYCLVFLGILVS